VIVWMSSYSFIWIWTIYDFFFFLFICPGSLSRFNFSHAWPGLGPSVLEPSMCVKRINRFFFFSPARTDHRRILSLFLFFFFFFFFWE
jgi:hypothetical protein